MIQIKIGYKMFTNQTNSITKVESQMEVCPMNNDS